MCLLELAIGSLLPLFFFWTYNLSGKVMNKTMVVRNAIFIILGVILHRTNVVITGMWKAAGHTYYPSMGEILITIGLTSFGILVYLFFAENFDIFSGHDEVPANAKAEKGKIGIPVEV
jgi:Ni/Fe-hydrogenase subunit HybB-like protein